MNSRAHVGTPRWLTLDRDERVWLRVRPSKNLLLVTFAVGTLLLLGVGALALTVDVPVRIARLLSAAVLVVVFLLTAVVYLLTRRHEYAVSNRRVYAAVGLTSTEVEQVDLSRVTDVTVVRPGWQRRLNLGEVRLSNDGEPLVRLRYVEHPEWIRDQLLDSLTDAR